MSECHCRPIALGRSCCRGWWGWVSGANMGAVQAIICPTTLHVVKLTVQSTTCKWMYASTCMQVHACKRNAMQGIYAVVITPADAIHLLISVVPPASCEHSAPSRAWSQNLVLAAVSFKKPRTVIPHIMVAACSQGRFTMAFQAAADCSRGPYRSRKSPLPARGDGPTSHVSTMFPSKSNSSSICIRTYRSGKFTRPKIGWDVYSTW